MVTHCHAWFWEPQQEGVVHWNSSQGASGARRCQLFLPPPPLYVSSEAGCNTCNIGIWVQKPHPFVVVPIKHQWRRRPALEGPGQNKCCNSDNAQRRRCHPSPPSPPPRQIVTEMGYSQFDQSMRSNALAARLAGHHCQLMLT